jgi:hypothetical protein
MRKYLPCFIIALVVTSFIHCSKKGEPITEARFGTYKFTTFTIDTFRFKVVLNNEVLTDSLLTPQNIFSKSVGFFQPEGSLKIFNANTNQLILDSAITMKTGTTTFSLVQFISGDKPVVPQLPAEAPPAAGNYKARFQYVAPVNPIVPFYDSIKFFVRIQDATAPGGYRTLDSAVLRKGGITKYYEAPSNLRFRIRITNPLTNVQITSPNQNVISLDNPPTGFNTAIVRGTNTTSSTTQGPYLFEARKVY